MFRRLSFGRAFVGAKNSGSRAYCFPCFMQGSRWAMPIAAWGSKLGASIGLLALWLASAKVRDASVSLAGSTGNLFSSRPLLASGTGCSFQKRLTSLAALMSQSFFAGTAAPSLNSQFLREVRMECALHSCEAACGTLRPLLAAGRPSKPSPHP